MKQANNTVKTRHKRRFFNALSKKMIAIFIIMTILISFSSCIVGYLKYSSTIKQLYNENSYSIASIVQNTITPEMGDFLESLIVYETDENGNYVLNEYGHKIPELQKVGDTVCAKVNLDMYADPATLSGDELEKYNRYYEILDEIDGLRASSGAKYILMMILCDGDRESDPYYEVGQEKYQNPYGVYFVDARMEDKTLLEIGLSDDAIIETAATYGEKLTKADIRDENGRLYDRIYDSYCRIGIGQQTRCAANIYYDGLQIFLTDKKSDHYLETNTEYGMTAEAILPFKNSEGKNVGIISVDVEMSIIKTTLRSYIFSAALITVGLVVLLMVIILLLMNYNVIKPIKMLTDASEKFIDENMTIDDSITSIKTGDEIETLATSFHKMSEDLVEYVNDLATVTAEKERIGAELDVATHIQASMLPCIFPPYPDRDEFDIYATMDPAKEVGGDFYDFFMVDDTHIAIVMADVSGKGVPAALFMVIAKTLLKDHTSPDCELGQVFTEVNDILCESNSQGMFVTAFEGVLDLVTGEFRFVNAGHEMPFICKKGEKYKPYEIRPGFVLAGMEGIKYKSGVIQLDVGDKLYQYTDGVTEATNSDNQLYGMARLENILGENADKSPTDLLPAIKKDIDKFVGEAPQFDDITMLCIEYKKKCER